MPLIIDANYQPLAAYEGSTYGPVTVSFFDAAGDAVVPSTATWTLTDSDGNVINNRSDVILTPAETVDIVLSGDDLAISPTEEYQTVLVDKVLMREVKRYLGVSAVYSSTEGSNLPLNAEAEFALRNLITV